jgi:phosphatidylserine decarboxylase
MGWFEHGSTIIMLIPQGFTFCPAIREGAKVRMGQAILQLPKGGEPAAQPKTSPLESVE